MKYELKEYYRVKYSLVCARQSFLKEPPKDDFEEYAKKEIERSRIAEIVYKDPEFYVEKYNKPIRYLPDVDSKTLKRLIYQKSKNQILKNFD